MERAPLLQKPRNGLTTLIIIALILSGIFLYLNPQERENTEVPLSTFIESVKLGDVSAVRVKDNRVDITLKDGKEVYTIKEPRQSISDILEGVPADMVSKVKIQVEDTEGDAFWMNLLISVVPFLLIVGFFLFMFRQAQGANNQALAFGKSRARLFDKENKKTTFADVAGAEEAKGELVEVVDFLKNPGKYQNMGAKIPKGVLLIGAPGTGKTLLARAVAGEANVPFFNISGSEFVEMFVGVGASRVRDLFRRAKRNAPCIVFIDEIDAVGRQRGAGLGGGHDEREQTLNQILTEMDGFETDTNVIVCAASVTGDTPVLVRWNDTYQLKPIAEVIDSYYELGEEGVEKDAAGLEVLGFERRARSDGKRDNKNLYFGRSAFKKVRSVFRHQTNEIYEIRFLGGSMRTTGNHSVFVRTQQGLCAKRVDELKPGEFLADIPYIANRTSKKREIRSYQFTSSFRLFLPVYQEFPHEELQYNYAVAHRGVLSQSAIAATLGVAQTTISKWQITDRQPREFSHAYFKHNLPEKIFVTPDLCRLFGYYVAEGYARKEIDFCFHRKEEEYIRDVKDLMYIIFGIKPDAERQHTANATNIIYYSRPLAEFFKEYGGEGAHHKHIPPFLFEAPREYFIEFLRGYSCGDGHMNNRGGLEMTSVSKQLILELQWLARMHGFKGFINSFTVRAGRTINGGNPLPETVAWRLGFGKSQNPLRPYEGKESSVKRAKILKITKKPFTGYVYDFCGCENEAFFGGMTPVLLHNTNRPDVLDPALLRPGRFDRRVVVNQPDIKEREAILKVHAKGKPLSRDVELGKIARQTSGFVGADLENLMNEAAILAARHNKKKVGMREIERSIEKVLMGPERKSKVMSKKEKEITAFHEVGHALVAHLSPGCDPVHKVSIISRGMALGVTWFMPEEDKHLYSKSKFEAELASLLGGYVAEELTFGHENITTGASNDLEKATEIARKMVTQYGMSELGPVIYGDHNREVFLGRDFGHVRNYSEEISSKIDAEIRRLIAKAYDRAKDILTKWRKKLTEIAAVLLEQESLTREEFLDFFKGEKISQPIPIEIKK